MGFPKIVSILFDGEDELVGHVKRRVPPRSRSGISHLCPRVGRAASISSPWCVRIAVRLESILGTEAPVNNNNARRQDQFERDRTHQPFAGPRTASAVEGADPEA